MIWQHQFAKIIVLAIAGALGCIVIARLILLESAVAWSTAWSLESDRPLEPPSLLGIASVPFPKDNPATRERIDLGRQLFFDPRLSSDESISCASCHKPAQGVANNTVRSQGIGGTKGIR